MMKNINTIYSSQLYEIAYFIVCFFGTLKLSMIGHGLRESAYLIPSVLLAVYSNIHQKKCLHYRQCALLLFIGFLSVILLITSRSYFPLVLFTLYFCGIGHDSRKLCKIYIFGAGAAVLLSLIFSYIGITEDRIFYFYRDSMLERHSLGMTYPTTFSLYIFSLTAAYSYCRGKRITVFEILMMLLSYVFVYYKTYCRLEFYLGILFVIAIFLVKFKLLNHIIGVILSLSYIICMLFTILIQNLYMNNPVDYANLDKILSGRLFQTSLFFEEYNIKMLGQSVIMQGNAAVNFSEDIGYRYIDSFFFNYLF